jgi:hypothetical protein
MIILQAFLFYFSEYVVVSIALCAAPTRFCAAFRNRLSSGSLGRHLAISSILMPSELMIYDMLSITSGKSINNTSRVDSCESREHHPKRDTCRLDAGFKHFICFFM